MVYLMILYIIVLWDCYEEISWGNGARHWTWRILREAGAESS